MRSSIFAAMSAIALAAIAPFAPGMAQDTAALQPIESGYSGTAARWGNMIVASQPEPAELVRLARSGTVTVINLRTPREMEALGYDEAALVEELGMTYVNVPLDGRDFPHTSEALAKVSAALAAANGAPVLLHCASSGRASHMFAAWLIRARGMPVNEAITLARQIGLGTLPVENLLGTTFRMSEAEK